MTWGTACGAGSASVRAQERPLALLILTRDPTGRHSGRKTVLASAARSLERAGLRVEAVVLSRRPIAREWEGRRLHCVPLPGVPLVVGSAARLFLGARGCLNEALFDSRRVRLRVTALARARGACLVVADGLRTAGPALSTGMPVLVHLDDLLSDRYGELARGAATSQEDLLGFFAEQVPAALRPSARRAARQLLAFEARRADVRERCLTHRADAVAMTSQPEADELTRRTGRPVAALPMAVDARPPGDPAGADPASFVFLGLLDYAPNRAALRWWTEAVRPALDAVGGQDVRLSVIGHRSGDGLVSNDPRLRFTGYVEDLGAELRRHRGMVVPMLSGAGVKTKVLDGWSVGLPVVATPAGAAGLTAGAGLLVSVSAVAFAQSVLSLRDDGPLAARTGAAGRAVLVRDWSTDALTQRWAAAVAPLLDPPQLRVKR